MSKPKILVDSRRLARCIGWSHKDVMNYLDEECIPYKSLGGGVVFPGNMIERDMWGAYKQSYLVAPKGGRGKKFPKYRRGAKRRAAGRRKKRRFGKRRYGAGKKRVSRRRRKAGRSKRRIHGRRSRRVRRKKALRTRSRKPGRGKKKSRKRVVKGVRRKKQKWSTFWAW